MMSRGTLTGPRRLVLAGRRPSKRTHLPWWGVAPASLVLLLAGTAFALAASGAFSYREAPAAAEIPQPGDGAAPVVLSSVPGTGGAGTDTGAVVNVTYPGTHRIHPLARLVPDGPRYLAGRQGMVAVAVYDAVDGNTYGDHSRFQVRSASIIKVGIMAAVLHRVQQQRRPVSPQEHELLTAMIRWSDNGATSALLRRAGGARALQEYLRSIGLTDTQVNPYAWGYTLTTASDMVKLVAQLHFKQILTPELCEYGLGLMQEVIPTQRWGITAGLSPRASVAIKNGWYPENDGSAWRVHSVGSVSADGPAYVIAVLTQYPQSLGMAYGQETIAGIATRISRRILGR